jgi:hypothetical protein
MRKGLPSRRGRILFSLVHATVLLLWLCDGTIARRRGRSQTTAGNAPAVVPTEVVAARELIEKNRFDDAERHIRAQLLVAAQKGSSREDELQLLHGLALFELTRWGEAVLALRRAARADTSNQAVRARAQGYLEIASQAMTHTMFDTLAHRTMHQACAAYWPLVTRVRDGCATGECQPELVAPLTSGKGFRRGLAITPALHGMLLRHIESALGSTAATNQSRDWMRNLPGEDYKSIVPPGPDGKPRTRVVFLSPEQKQKVVNVVQPLVESWVGQPLQPSSVYGVRLCVPEATVAAVENVLFLRIIIVLNGTAVDTSIENQCAVIE